MALRPDTAGLYSYTTTLPLSFLQYEDEEEICESTQHQAICYIRIVFINNEYFRFRLNGCSDVFELRNEYSKQRAVGSNAVPIAERETNGDGRESKEIEFEDDTELHANDQIGKNDNGAFCVCGAIQYNVDEPMEEHVGDQKEVDGDAEIGAILDRDKMVEFVQCDYCFSV